MAESTVADSIKARQALVEGLEKLLEANRTKLTTDQAQITDLQTRKAAIEGRTREIELAILKNLSDAEHRKISAAPLPTVAQPSQDRPNVEELTPPPMESFTPVGSPVLQAHQPPPVPDDALPDPSAHPVDAPAPAGTDVATADPATTAGAAPAIPGADLLHSLAQGRPAGENGTYGQQAFKKRKMSRSTAEDEFAAFEGDTAMNSIDSTLGDLI